MSIAEIAVVYLWLVPLIGCARFVVFCVLDPEARRNSAQIVENWRELRSAKEQPTDVEQEVSRVSEWLQRLLRSGFQGAFVVISHKESDRFIQFRKYIQAPGDYGIELGFPNVEWSREYFPKVRDYCKSHQIPHSIRTEPAEHPLEFLYVNCGDDPQMAFDLTQGIWTEVFGLPLSAPRQYEGNGISAWGELVDRPDQEPISARDGWQRLAGQSLSPILAGILISAWIVTAAVAFFGFLIAFANIADAPPDWTYRYGEYRLSGTDSSLLFFGLYLACQACRVFWRTTKRPRQTVESWVYNTLLPLWAWFERLSLPLCGLLIWAGA